MKVALIQAPLGRPEPLVYPLGLAILGAAVGNQHDVRIFDPNLSGEREILQSLKSYSPDVIGVSIRNIDSQMKRDLFYYYARLKPFLKILHESFSDSRLIVGGSGFSLFPERIMKDNPGVYAGVYLEADESFPELLAHLDTPESVKGVFFRRNRDICFSGSRLLPAAETIPSPDFSLLHPKPYESNGGVGIQIKRGCPLKCAYCTYPHLNGDCFRIRPMDVVVQEIRDLIERYDVRELTFVDGIFNLPKPFMIHFLERLKEEKLPLKWRGWFTELGFDRALAELCRETGCREFSFSPDGYSDQTLAAMGKSIRKKDIHRIFKLARDVDGIRVAFNFFWNPPDQTLRDFLQMLWFAVRCKLVLRNKAGGIIFGNPRIEPGTGIFERAVQDGVITRDIDLLPETLEELYQTFYSHPPTRYLDYLYGLYSYAWRLKSGLFSTGGKREDSNDVVQ